MYTAEDYKAGRGRGVKVSTSVLPYLKAKQVNVVHNPAVTGVDSEEEPKAPTTPSKPKNPYDVARQEILREQAGEE